MKHLKTLQQLNESQENLNISDVISRLYYNLSIKYEIKISDILISLKLDKLYCYTQDEFGYLIQLDVVSLNDL